MSKFDFFQQLNSIINDSNDNESSDNETNEEICLIEFAPLRENHVKLDCGHTFNYEPLYRDVIANKYTKTSTFLNASNKTLNIRCPFCRSIHPGLLPVVPNYKIITIFY